MYAETLQIAQVTYAYSAWPPIIVGGCVLLLGVIILLREKASYASRAFFAMAASVALWYLSMGATYSVRNPDIAFWTARASLAAVAFLPSTLFFFVLIVTKDLHRLRWIGRGMLLASGALAIAALGTRWLTFGLVSYPWGFYPRLGSGGPVFVLFFVGLYSASLWLLYRRWQRPGTMDPQPERIRNLWLGASVTFLIAVDFLAAYGARVFPIGYLPAYAGMLLLTETIWRYRFKNLTPALAAPHILRALPLGLLVVDADGTVAIANQKACEFFEKSEKDLIGSPIQSALGDVFAPPRLDVLVQEGTLGDYELPWVNSKGTRRVLSISAAMFHYAYHTPAGFVCVIRDISPRKQAEEERRIAQEALLRAYDELEARVEERTSALTHEVEKRKHAEEALRTLAVTDALTGLYNRRGFLALAEQHLQIARREGKAFTIFLADLDDLKPLNDTFGHQEGDRALTQTAELLKKAFRATDTVARIGGDEFAIAVIEDHEYDQERLLARFRGTLSQFNDERALPYRLGISIGTARMESHHSLNVEQLMAEADGRLYQQKRLKTTAVRRVGPFDPSN